METLELPVTEAPVVEPAPATCTEDEIDLAAFELWREASRPDETDETA